MLDFLFGGRRKRKTSRAARVRKMALKVQRLKKAKSLKEAEVKYREQLSKLRGY